MRETIVEQEHRPGPRRLGVLALGLAWLVGAVGGGCGSSAPPAGTETQAGGRRSEMANFMKTQKPAAAAAARVRRHP